MDTVTALDEDAPARASRVRFAALPVPERRLSRGEMRKVHALPGEHMGALEPRAITALYHYPR